MPARESSAFVRASRANHSGEPADFLPDTSASFNAWLDSLRPNPTASSANSPFNFEGTLRIEGSASGVVNSQTGTLIIGEAAEFTGKVLVATAIVDGSVRGDIRASERVALGSTARVFGNIETSALTVQPGAIFEGQCHFLPPVAKALDEEQTSADSSTVSTGSSSLRTPSKADQPETAEPLALAAGR